jgi:cytochrome b6-f complex iron-sulfur subunit
MNPMNTHQNVSRHQFLKELGLKGAALMAVYCGGAALSSCGNKDEVVPQFTINLDDTTNVALKTNGGYIIKNDVVIAKTTSGSYAAVSVLCKHEDLKQVVYKKSTNEFFCTAHDARFDLSGTGLNQNGKDGLRSYTVALSSDGKTLTIG